MATGNFYRGTSQTQDARFSNKDKKLLNSREWPPEFDLKVNIKKVPSIFFIINYCFFSSSHLYFKRAYLKVFKLLY